jgi:hypothetical protein
MKIAPFTVILFFLFSFAAGPHAMATGQAGFGGLNMEYGARLYSMAGAGLSVINDVNSCLVDPSQLGGLKGLELCANGNKSFLETYAGSFSIAYPMPFGTFGFTVAKLNYGSAEFRNDDSATPDDTFVPFDSVYAVSFGNSFFRLLKIGLNAKYIVESLSRQDQREGFAVDMAAHIDNLWFNRLNVAFAVRDLGTSGTSRITLPLTFVFGISKLIEFRVPFLGISDIRPIANLIWTSDQNFRASGALELMWYHVPDLLDITGRCGYDGPSEAGFLESLRTGIGLHVKNFDLDYGFGWLGDLGMVHKLTFTFKWEAPEPSRTIRNISKKTIDKTLQEIDKKFEQGDKKTDNKK